MRMRAVIFLSVPLGAADRLGAQDAKPLVARGHAVGQQLDRRLAGHRDAELGLLVLQVRFKLRPNQRHHARRRLAVFCFKRKRVRGREKKKKKKKKKETEEEEEDDDDDRRKREQK